eukprot:3620286-Amphidinium_carterae.4
MVYVVKAAVNDDGSRQQNSAFAKISQGETSEEEQTDSLTWFRTDKGVQKFVGSGVGGPVWDNVWKRSTYNMDNGDLISEEPTTAITKKELHRPLPEGVRTVLHYRIKEGEAEEKVNESREENVTFKKPAGDPSHREIKAKAQRIPITWDYHPSCHLIYWRREEEMGGKHRKGA